MSSLYAIRWVEVGPVIIAHAPDSLLESDASDEDYLWIPQGPKHSMPLGGGHGEIKDVGSAGMALDGAQETQAPLRNRRDVHLRPRGGTP